MIGTVADDSPLTVTVDGAATPVTALALDHYTPGVGDRVLVVQEGSTLIVVGALA